MTSSNEPVGALDAVLRSQFAGRVAFVIGAAAGLGRAFTRTLASAGAAVIAADVDVEGCQRVAAELSDADTPGIVPVRCDVTSESEIDGAMALTRERFGRLDILLNNAGLHLARYNQPFGAIPRDEIRRLFDVNVMGVVNGTLAAVPLMSESGGGSVVSIASIASNRSTSPYGVSKLAVRGITVAFAKELAPHRIRVNAVSPGLIGTDNAVADLSDAFIDKMVNREQLIHRLGTLDDIVGAVLFLCSDAASFITGETIRVSGGQPLAM